MKRWRQTPVLELPAAAARDAQGGIGGELAEEPLEVVRLEGDVGVELDDDVRLLGRAWQDRR